jgi:two-component system cell cycle sensor histidine kinase/response regulator CckA
MLKKVLIVDDDPVIRNLIAALLRRRGFLVVQAANGEEALTLLGSEQNQGGQSEYDLLLIDLMMPKLSGWEVLEYIQKTLPDLIRHVVVISAAGESELADLQRRGACGVVLPKPFDVEAFYQKIGSCIRGPYDPTQLSPSSDTETPTGILG